MEKLGTLVFKDVETKEILIWKHIESETVKDYKYLKEELLELSYTIKSVTLDGKRGLSKAFKDIPIQMCHFHPVLQWHQLKPKSTINRYLKLTKTSK